MEDLRQLQPDLVSRRYVTLILEMVSDFLEASGNAMDYSRLEKNGPLVEQIVSYIHDTTGASVQ